MEMTTDAPIIKDVARQEIVLGIDLGTSFSTAAAWVQGKMYLVPDERGEPCIPTVIHYGEDGPPVIGFAALQLRRRDPENTVSGIKRILGRNLDSPEGRVFAASSAVNLTSAPNGRIILSTRCGEHTAEEIASTVYAHLRRLSENRFQRKISKAVLTIPASADDAVQAATIRAAKQAGLEVLETIHEPTSAAVAFGLDRFQGHRKLLIYDFGGGTFDVTVMQQTNQNLSPIAIGGDATLGGDDFDHELAQYAASIIWRRHQIEIQHDIVRWDRLNRESETTKRALSAMQAARLRVKDAFTLERRPHNLDITVSRENIAPRWKKLVERSIQTTAETMVRAGLRPGHINNLLLVGGTTYVPAVRDAITRVINRQGEHPGDPQTAVACGAAVTAARHALRAA
ncbi:MAG: Hsp70 family protein [Myxococcales bacterium]|nr:Hsp70 family protein [Myxococcales bacterium]